MCAFTYSVLDYLDDIILFIGIAVVFRMIHGLAASLSSVLSNFEFKNQHILLLCRLWKRMKLLNLLVFWNSDGVSSGNIKVFEQNKMEFN